MAGNPTLLVDQIASASDVDTDTLRSLDAVFVPFRSRPSYVRELLAQFRWFKGPVYLMPSDENDITPLHTEIYAGTVTLRVEDIKFKRLYRSMLTSQHRLTSSYCTLWDLPEKRNYALLFARRKGYKSILLIDDDIRQVTQSSACKGTRLLNRYNVSGCFVSDFPDTSVHGHLERIANREIFPFLSGSFLFISPLRTQGFFPCIYNEDWLFMLPYILERSICSFGTIKQMAYDPFCDLSKADFQEFGEIVAEGLYGLVKTGDYGRRYRLETWERVIQQRLATLAELSRILDRHNYGLIIDAIIKANTMITPIDCVDFVTGWESDITVWNEYLEETKNESR